MVSGYLIYIMWCLLRFGFFKGLYIRTAKLIRGIPAVTSILWPLAGVSSSSSAAASLEPDSSDDYPKIRVDAYGDDRGESPDLHGGPQRGSIAQQL
jgi:hypothetical protein